MRNYLTKMMDIDGNTYKTVKIGDQIWLAENLKVTHYRNGDAIPNVADYKEWADLKTGAYCEYYNNAAHADRYGCLYNWYTVNNSQNIAPVGWHVPTDDEWKQLEIYLGMIKSEADDTGYRGTDQGSQLAGNADLWYDGDLKGNAAFGSSGFAALPGGYRSKDGSFYYMGDGTSFWSSMEQSSANAWYRGLYYPNTYVYRFDSYKQGGFSVRLVRD